MSLLDFFSFLTRATFVVLSLVTTIDWLRHRNRARLDIALLFISLGATLTVQLLLETTGWDLPWLTTLSTLVFAAQPYLALRVAEYFQPTSRLFRLAALLGLVLLWALVLLAPPSTPLAMVYALVYFVTINGYTSFLFVRGAFTTAGVTRQRLRLASVGTALVAALLALIGLAVFVPTLLEPLTAAIFLVALLAITAYFLGFATPRPLRQFWQLSELYRFFGQNSGEGISQRAQHTVESLCHAAERIVGGTAVVALWEHTDEKFHIRQPGKQIFTLTELSFHSGIIAQAWRDQSPCLATKPSDFGFSTDQLATNLQLGALFAIPVRTIKRDWGLLLVALPHAPLFEQDDMNMLSLLADQSALALDNDMLLQEQQNHVVQLQGLNESLEQRVAQRTQDLEAKQKELQLTEARYRLLFDRSPQPLWVYDTETLKFLAVNEAMVAHYGYSREEFLYKSILDIRPPQQVAEVLKVIQDLAPRPSTTGPWTHIKKDGTHIKVEVSSHSIQFDDRPARLVVANDITARLRVEEERNQLHQELEQRVLDRTDQLQAANAELEAFSYSVSHDLRAPLRHIGGYVQLLQRNSSSQLDDKSTRYLQVIAESAKRMGNLIDDLLTFSRIGRTELSTSRVNLNELVEITVRELQPELGDRNICWEYSSLPEVRGDPNLLRLVMQNLVGNAVKYTGPRDPARIEIGCLPDEREHIIFVRDNGVGFDMKYADKLFGVFQRLHRSEEFDGTGIGLANVRRIISRHEGRTWAQAEPDKGATFYFSLSIGPSVSPVELQQSVGAKE